MSGIHNVHPFWNSVEGKCQYWEYYVNKRLSVQHHRVSFYKSLTGGSREEYERVGEPKEKHSSEIKQDIEVLEVAENKFLIV